MVGLLAPLHANVQPVQRLVVESGNGVFGVALVFVLHKAEVTLRLRGGTLRLTEHLPNLLNSSSISRVPKERLKLPTNKLIWCV